MQGWNYSMFMAALKALIANKQTILTASQSVENTVQIVYSLCLSVLSAYESLKFGTYARGVPDEDAAFMIEHYGRE